MQPYYEKQLEINRFYPVTDMNHPQHLQSEPELFYVLEGSCEFQVNETSYLVQAGELIIAFPLVVHAYRCTEPYTGMITIPDAALLTDFEKLLRTNLPARPIVPLTAPLKENLTIFGANLRPASYRQQLLRKSSINMAMALLLSELTLKPRREVSDPALTYRIISYASENYRSPLTLNAIATAVGCSEYTVSKIFSHKIGLSLPSYLAHLRVNYAENLLEATDLPVTEIAFEAGFETTRSFNRSFMQLKNLTPRDYRRQFQLHP